MPDKPKPSFDKSPADLVDRFHEVLSARPDAHPRKMFGNPAAFVNGNLATGLYEASWFVRLSESDAAELTAAGGGSFEPMPGRPMRSYIVLPAGLVDDPAAAGDWVDRAMTHVATLPPK